MLRNMTILKKSEFKSLKFNQANLNDLLESIKLIPLGVDEIYTYTSFAPIVISGEEQPEFALFPAVAKQRSIFDETRLLNIPNYLKSYPFMMVKVMGKDNNYATVIGIDKNEKYVGEDKEHNIFNNEQELDELSGKIINNLKSSYEKRELSKIILYNLKEKGLLQKQSFKINVDGKDQNILTDYYIVNRKKLLELDDEVLVDWAKKGWLSIIDAHIYSLRNFEKLVDILR